MTHFSQEPTIENYIKCRYGENDVKVSFVDIGEYEARCFERFDYGEIVDEIVKKLLNRIKS